MNTPVAKIVSTPHPLLFSHKVLYSPTQERPPLPFWSPVSFMAINISPDNEHPHPENLNDEVGESLKENTRIAADTASLMAELGMPFEMTEDDQEEARNLFKSVDIEKKRGTPTSSYNPPNLYKGAVAVKLSALLDSYDGQVINDAVQARNYITNRLLEISQCGDVKYELRAIELLGKLSDVGAFTEKSEITVTHKTSDDLRRAIQDKIQRLLDLEVVDVEAKTLEEELGIDESSAITDAAEEAPQSP
jgi:hypothetical protein